eukprot:CAMPEP_0119019074 /NCGR_PEP_ID=MMETSP1176-20130426/20919_1 /TAXON_ID=265551 /ORGANISM="Synedropsis recta cf, Strain CCMP1620" /LENGTH=361 /DNA_ID=CAMNT_0006973205 /DNA_START=93 /DNA_END=1175 /DNA_ORIENTATION=+
MPTRLHHHPVDQHQHHADPIVHDKLHRLAHALATEIPLRIEIRGVQQQILIIPSSQERLDFSFPQRIPIQALELLSQASSPQLPKVLLVELYNVQLVQVLRAISGKVQNLDVANCCVTDQDGGGDGGFDLRHVHFQCLTHLQVYSSHLREDHLFALLQASSQHLVHFALYLMAGTQSIDAIFHGIHLPRLASIDFRGRFVTRTKCFHIELLPNLTNVVIVETLGSQVYLGHVVNHTIEEMLLGKTIATAEDLRLWGETLRRADCKIRRMHLFAVDLQADVGDWELEGLMQAIRHNQSLVEIVIGSDAFRSRQEELRSLMMRNKYLTQGLGRLTDIRMLPQFLNKAQRRHRCTMFGTASREQ